MNKNKKIIALVCAIAMIFSVFAAFTVTTSAAGEGIVLEYDKDASTTTKIVVNAKYVGTDAINGYAIRLQLPQGYSKVSCVSGLTGIPTPTEFTNTETLVYGISGTSANPVSSDDKKIVTVTIELNEALTQTYKMELLEKTMLTLTDGTTLGIGEQFSGNTAMAASAIKIPKDPNEEVKNPLPKPSTDPEVTLPETKDPVTVEKGIALEYDKAASDSKKIVLVAKYVGVDAINGYAIRLQLPQGYSKVSCVSGLAGIPTPTEFTNTETLVYGISGTSANPVSSDDKKIVTVTIEFENDITSDYIFELLEKTMLTLTDGTTLGVGAQFTDDKVLPPAWVEAPAGAEESLANSIPLIKGDDNKGLVTAPSSELSGDAYAVLVVTKSNGDPAVYGTDYVAYYNGTKLTEQQLTNLLAGLYCETEGKSLVEMLQGVVIEYNNGIKGSLQIVDGEDVVVDGDIPTTGGTTPAPTQGPKKASLTASTYTVAVNQVVVVKPVLKLGNQTITDAKYIFDYAVEPTPAPGAVAPEPSATPSPEWRKYTQALTAYEKEISDDKAVYDFVGGHGEYKPDEGWVGVESAKVTGIKAPNRKNLYVSLDDATIAKYFADGTYTLPDKYPVAVDINVTRAVTGSGSGSGSGGTTGESSSGSNGPIAGPGTNPTTPNVPVGGDYYIDLDSTPWAVTAINAMTAKNLLQGYGDRTFRPNNNVTRAEFAQMVVRVFNVPASTNGEEFGDVSTSDWFYSAVKSCAAAGIVNGYGNGYFDPNKTIDRQEMAVMVYRGARNMGKSDYLKPVVPERVFVDEPDIADYAKEAVKVLQMAGVISGMDEYHYCPVEKATRAQSAVMLYPFAN